MAVAKIGQRGPKLPQSLPVQRIRHLRHEHLGQPFLAGGLDQLHGLEQIALGKPGLAPVGKDLAARQFLGQGNPGFFHGQNAVKTCDMLRAFGIGHLCGLNVTQRLLRAPDPVPRAAQRNRRTYRSAQALEMIQRQFRLVEEPQGQVARQPFQIGIGPATVQPVQRCQLIGRLIGLGPHHPPRQRAALARPACRLAQPRLGPALVNYQRDGQLVVVPLQEPLEPVECQPRIGPHRFGQDRDPGIQPAQALLRRAARCGQLAPVLAHQGLHQHGILQPPPKRHVMTRRVMRRQQLTMLGHEQIMFGRTQFQRPPGQHQPDLGLALLPGGELCIRKTKRRHACRRLIPIEEGQHLGIRGGLEGRLALFAQAVQARPVAVALQKGQNLVRAALSGAQPHPLHDLFRDGPGPLGQFGGTTPPPLLHRLKGAGQWARRRVLLCAGRDRHQ